MPTWLIIRLVVLAAILAVLQVAFGLVSGYKDTPTPVRLCDQYLAEGREILYLGESTIYTVDPRDADQAPINEMLQRLLPEYRIGCIAHDAYHLELYEAFCQYAARKPNPPRLIIVPINLGTVSPYWDRRPEYQFERIKLFLRHDSAWFRMFFRPLAAFRALNLTPISEREYNDTLVLDGKTPVGTIREFTKTEYAVWTEEHTRDQLILRYMYRAPADHPKVLAAAQIAREMSEADVSVVFYFTPIDWETGEQYLGERFTTRIRENAQTFNDALSSEDVKLMDLSLALDQAKFHWGSTYPNEHLNEEGRRFVAEQLAKAVRERFERNP